VTRVDDALLREHRKHRLDVYEGAAPIYNVVSSDNCQKLTLKLSKTRDEPRGMYMTTLLYFVNNAHGFYQTVPWCSYMEETKLCHFTAELLIIAHLFALNNEHCFVTVKLMHVHFIMVVVA